MGIQRHHDPENQQAGHHDWHHQTRPKHPHPILNGTIKEDHQPNPCRHEKFIASSAAAEFSHRRGNGEPNKAGGPPQAPRRGREPSTKPNPEAHGQDGGSRCRNQPGGKIANRIVHVLNRVERTSEPFRVSFLSANYLLNSPTSRFTTSRLVIPSDSAVNVVITRCRSTDSATAIMSSIRTM